MQPGLIVPVNVGIQETATLITRGEVLSPMPFFHQRPNNAFRFAVGVGVVGFGELLLDFMLPAGPGKSVVRETVE